MFATVADDRIFVFGAQMIEECLEEIPMSIYDEEEDVWTIPFSEKNAELLDFFGVDIDPQLFRVMDKTEEKPIIQMPIKATPYQQQIKAYNFVLRLLGIVSDESQKCSSSCKGEDKKSKKERKSI